MINQCGLMGKKRTHQSNLLPFFDQIASLASKGSTANVYTL